MRVLPLASMLLLMACGGGPSESTSSEKSAAPEPVLLVSQKAASSIAFYTWDGQEVATVPVGTHPHEMVLSADGRVLYTTDNGTMQIEQAGNGGNTVSIIDVAARERVGIVDLGEYYRPHGIDINPATGEVLVSTENPDRLLVIDPAQRKVVRDYDTKGQTPHIVRVSPDGKRAFVSNARSGTVAAIELASGEVTLIEAGSRPEGSVLSADGKSLYVANRDSHEITIIDTEKNTRVAQIPTGKSPVRVGLTSDGKTLIYALFGENKVGFADIAERREVAQIDLKGQPVSLEMSADGRYAFAGAQDAGIVYVISAVNRTILKHFPTAAGAGPDPVMQFPGTTLP